MARRPKTPQEKKRLDYERQRRGAYFNSAHGARKTLPRAKRRHAHVQRQALRNELPRTGRPEDVVDQLDRAEARLSRHYGNQGRKSPGRTLRDWVDWKLERRAEFERQAIRPQDKRPPRGRQRRDRYRLRSLVVDGQVVCFWANPDGTPVRPSRHSSRWRAQFHPNRGIDVSAISAPAAAAPARCPACPATGSRSGPARP
jgi:hypothetical protein